MPAVSTAVIWALPELANESALVAAAPAAGLRIVRRCVDAADVLAHASIDAMTTIVISDDVPRLDADIAHRLTAGGREVVGVAQTPAGARRLRAWGVTSVVEIDADATTTLARIAGACQAARIARQPAPAQQTPAQRTPAQLAPQPFRAEPTSTLPTTTVASTALPNEDAPRASIAQRWPVGRWPVGRWPVGRWPVGRWPVSRERTRERTHERTRERTRAGQPVRTPIARENTPSVVIAVWAPPGSPGCTTTAIGVADELARQGRSVLLVDADLRSPSLALVLGIADDTSGLLLATRQAEHGLLNPNALTQAARSYRDGLAVLTGLPRPERRGELRTSALDAIWTQARSAFDVTVVDLGAVDIDGTERDPSLLGEAEPAIAARSALHAADGVIVVGRGDALGLSRLAQTRLPDAPGALALVDPPRRAHARALDLAADATRRLSAQPLSMQRIGWDGAWADALAHGATIAELRPRARVRRAYRSLAAATLSAAAHDTEALDPAA